MFEWFGGRGRARIHPARTSISENSTNIGRVSPSHTNAPDLHSAATKIQSLARGASSRREAAAHRSQVAAATKIQALARGAGTRANLAQQREQEAAQAAAATKIQALVRARAVRKTEAGQHMQLYQGLHSKDAGVREASEKLAQQKLIDVRAAELRDSVGTSWRHGLGGLGVSLKQNARRALRNIPYDPLGAGIAYQREESAREQARSARESPEITERPSRNTRDLATKMAVDGTSWKYGFSGAKTSAAQQMRKLGRHMPGWGRLIEKRRIEVEEARGLARKPDAATSALIDEAKLTRERNAIDRVAEPSMFGNTQARAEKAVMSFAATIAPTAKASKRLNAASSTLASALQKADSNDDDFVAVAQRKRQARADATLGGMAHNPSTLGKFSENATLRTRSIVASALDRLGADHASKHLLQLNAETKNARELLGSTELESQFDSYDKRNASAIKHQDRGNNLDLAGSVTSAGAGVIGTLAGRAADTAAPGTGEVTKVATKAVVKVLAGGAYHFASGEHKESQREFINSPKNYDSADGRHAATLDYASMDLEGTRVAASKKSRNKTLIGAARGLAKSGIASTDQTGLAKAAETKVAEAGLTHINDVTGLETTSKYNVKAMLAQRGRTLRKIARAKGNSAAALQSHDEHSQGPTRRTRASVSHSAPQRHASNQRDEHSK